MVAVVAALMQEEARRRLGKPDAPEIPTRPDHGHAMWRERGAAGVRPGYSFAGRMKGLAELRGVMRALQSLPAP